MTSTARTDRSGPAPLALSPISRSTLALFAGASGDINPIHIDLDVAHAAGLEDVFAHGMLSMAYLDRLIIGWLPQERVKSFSVRFAAITPIHGEPTCSARVTSITETADERLATLELLVSLHDGTATVMGQATVVID